MQGPDAASNAPGNDGSTCRAKGTPEAELEGGPMWPKTQLLRPDASKQEAGESQQTRRPALPELNPVRALRLHIVIRAAWLAGDYHEGC